MGSWYMGALLTNIDTGTTDVAMGDFSNATKMKKGKEIQTFGSPTAFAINKNSKEQELAQKIP